MEDWKFYLALAIGVLWGSVKAWIDSPAKRNNLINKGKFYG